MPFFSWCRIQPCRPWTPVLGWSTWTRRRNRWIRQVSRHNSGNASAASAQCTGRRSCGLLYHVRADTTKASSIFTIDDHAYDSIVSLCLPSDRHIPYICEGMDRSTASLTTPARRTLCGESFQIRSSSNTKVAAPFGEPAPTNTPGFLEQISTLQARVVHMKIMTCSPIVIPQQVQGPVSCMPNPNPDPCMMCVVVGSDSPSGGSGIRDSSATAPDLTAVKGAAEEGSDDAGSETTVNGGSSMSGYETDAEVREGIHTRFWLIFYCISRHPRRRGSLFIAGTVPLASAMHLVLFRLRWPSSQLPMIPYASTRSTFGASS